MSGIVGATAQRDIVPVLLDGLRRLEYRGYDSAGVSVHDGNGSLGLRRCVGRISDLEKKLERAPLSSLLGIGHTRWATHGGPEERNAHPQISNDCIAVVHNGIIENHETLRAMLTAQGYTFNSDTDTEVVAHLIHHHLMRTGSLLQSVRHAVTQLTGPFALAVISQSSPGLLIVTRRHRPLAIGVGQDEQFVTSAPEALIPLTQRFIFLEEGDVAELCSDDVSVIDTRGKGVIRDVRQVENGRDSQDKAPYAHYVLKEIHEQPGVLDETLREHVAGDRLLTESLGFKAFDLVKRIKAVQLVACGTSYHACEMARYWIESIAGLPCSIDLASEYCNRAPAVQPDCLFAALSQSGETADTLAALHYAKSAGYLGTLAVCNAPDSTLVRQSDMALLTCAGPEIGVSSTKTFTSQLLSMLLLASLLGRRNWTDTDIQRVLIRQMANVGTRVQSVLDLSDEIRALGSELAVSKHALFLARGLLYPIAREGALKLKEISYIHAEAYAAGELKHGPVALIDDDMPVIALAPSNGSLNKIKASLREVRARGGRLVVFTDGNSGIEPEDGVRIVRLPLLDEIILPIGYAVALQLLAYYAALARGTDIDHPRNLAKAVTVE